MKPDDRPTPQQIKTDHADQFTDGNESDAEVRSVPARDQLSGFGS